MSKIFHRTNKSPTHRFKKPKQDKLNDAGQKYFTYKLGTTTIKKKTADKSIEQVS